MAKKKNYKVGYQMPKLMFDSILKTRKGEDEKKKNPYAFVCEIVNAEFGLMREVNHITVI